MAPKLRKTSTPKPPKPTISSTLHRPDTARTDSSTAAPRNARPSRAKKGTAVVTNPETSTKSCKRKRKRKGTDVVEVEDDHPIVPTPPVTSPLPEMLIILGRIEGKMDGLASTLDDIRANLDVMALALGLMVDSVGDFEEILASIVR